MTTHLYKINEQVIVKFRDKLYPAIVIDLEQASVHVDRYTKKPSPEMEYTGRYGVKFVGENPTIIDKPYFWEKELLKI